MSGDLTTDAVEVPCMDSAGLAAAIAATDFSNCAATVIGYGLMGREFVKALRALGVRRIRVCSRSSARLEELHGIPGIETVSGGFEQLERRPQAEELGIIAIPIPRLIEATTRLVALGFCHLLIEKPVSLWADQIETLAQALEREEIEAMCAYNRIAYPSFHEVKARIAREGITSCLYTFTELLKPDWPTRFSIEELARWGIGNSLHVIGMAHGLIGLPAQWSGYRTGKISWHKTGAIFVGSGLSDQGIPFAYHADWGSTGRWSVEVHSPVSSYRLCPLEQVSRRTSALGEWQVMPVVTFADTVKAGILEEVAAMLAPTIRHMVPLVSLRQAARLTRYAEAVFGYHL